MKKERLDSLLALGASLDTETYLIRAGLLAPRLVCGSAAWWDAVAGKLAGELLDREQVLNLFAALLEDHTRVIVGANVAFDLLVLAVTAAQCGVDLMPELYAALMDDERVYDLQHAEALDAVAEGCLGKDPRTGGPLINPETGRRGRYSLSICQDIVLGRQDAKANDEHRLHYDRLDGVPMAEWPQSARDYPVDDAVNTLEIALAQTGHLPRAGAHRWGVQTVCDHCGIHPKSAFVDGSYSPCRTRRRSRNLHDLAAQVGTAYAMHSAAAWGFRVNQATVSKVEAHSLEGRSEAEEPFIAAGLLRRNRDLSTSRDMSAICRRVALAYGADTSRPCSTCRGTRKVVSSKAKPVKCGFCKGTRFVGQSACPTCSGVGTIPDPRQLVNCTACGATGLDLDAAPNLPKTETGRVGTGRDVLFEAGDETLMALAEHSEDSKVLETYVPALRRARVPVAGHAEACPSPGGGDCSCEGPYRDIPLTLFPNVVLETGRTSYGGVIQLFPRKPGFWKKRESAPDEYVPSLRECVEARPGFVFSSEDYESGELVTHAQSCIWICGESALARALVTGRKIHNALGASMIGLSYEEFQRRIKEQLCKDARQAAKPGNFGFPGGMGPVKMVLQQRKQGPDTPHPSGPTTVKNDAGDLVPGYKGLRFCILMDNAEACGTEKLTQWRDQPIPPTCAQCIDCAKRLKDAWIRTWPENEDYFRYINDCCENGMMVGEAHLRLWPYLRDFFAPGRLAPGEIMQHVSGRVRGNTDYCSAANGFFQGLLADLAKSALRRISRECYDHTVRVPELAHENGVKSAYAGGPSPLLGSRPIVFQHDEIILEHPESAAHDGATRVSEIMVDEMRHYCPDLAPACAAEPTLMRRWYKGASPTRDAAGRLIPWEPPVPKACS